MSIHVHVGLVAVIPPDYMYMNMHWAYKQFVMPNTNASYCLSYVTYMHMSNSVQTDLK